MEEKLKVLILIRPFIKSYSKHKPKFESIRAIENFAEVKYWYSNGDIHDILEILNFTPDFIFHYDMGWEYALAPNITVLMKSISQRAVLLLIPIIHHQREVNILKIIKLNLYFL